MQGWLSILPPLIAILVALWRKEVIISLCLGILSAELILADGNPLLGFIGLLERGVGVFEDDGNTRVLLFGILVGALLEWMQTSGGVTAFLRRLSNWGWTKSPRQAGLLATVTGILIFVETSMSCLAAGVVSRKLFDRFGMSRARLAFIVDATSAPISVLVLLNAWGAYIMRLVEPYSGGAQVAVLARSIPFNFYPLAVLAMVFYTVFSGRTHGALRVHESQNPTPKKEVQPREEAATSKARFMVIPLVVLIVGMAGFMYYTGKGNLLNGSGSRSVLWSVSAATLLLYLLLMTHKRFGHKELMDQAMAGMGKLLPVVLVMLLSFALGSSCKALGTGPFIAGALGDFLPKLLVAPLIFSCAALAAFTTGTSWGTFAIMIPIAMPLGVHFQLPAPFVLSAVLGGGVFGDHCSPISDTTVISSLASGCDHLDHVKTQLPYALTAAGISIIAYLLIGLAL